MNNKINLTMEDLDKVSGGEIGPAMARLYLKAIQVFKQNGKTLEVFLEEARRYGWNEESIAFCTANW